MKRHRRKIVAGVLTLLGVGLLTLWVFWLKPLQEHHRWYERVSGDIRSLAGKRPPDVSREEWEFVVCWTLHMHANCGWSDRVDRAAREPFAAELERRLAGPVSLATIDWIWDEYCRFSRSGQTYSDKFRPTHPDNFRPDNIRAALGGGGCGIVVP